MKRILVTGGTVFVSRYAAEYFAGRGYDVYVLNRGSREQSEGVRLIRADRHALKNELKETEFDAVIDVTAYDGSDITDLLNALGRFSTYIMISSSAVYPDTGAQPFREDAETGENWIWGRYGTDKIEAERTLLERVKDAYILRPPYLYGPLNNVYREAFVFDCAMQDRSFFLPRNGEMSLQFFHIRDLCRLMEVIIETGPADHIINTGNRQTITVRDWVKLCYACCGRTPQFVNVTDGTEQRNYFSFYDYEYTLDVGRQEKLLKETTDLKAGLMECYEWYKDHMDEVRKKPFAEYIDTVLIK